MFSRCVACRAKEGRMAREHGWALSEERLPGCSSGAHVLAAAVVSLPRNFRQVHRPPWACKQTANKEASSWGGAGKGEALRPFTKQKQKNKWCTEDRGCTLTCVLGGPEATGNDQGSTKASEAGEYQALEGSRGDLGLLCWVSNGSSENRRWRRVRKAAGCRTESSQSNLDGLFLWFNSLGWLWKGNAVQLAHKTAALQGLEKTLFRESQNAGGVTGARAHGWLGKAAVPRVAGSASETSTPAELRHHKCVGACAVVLTQTGSLPFPGWPETWPSTRGDPCVSWLGSRGGRAGRWGHAGRMLCHSELCSNRPHEQVQISAPHSARDFRLLLLSGEGNGYPLQYFCLENSMDRGAWPPAVHGIPKSWTLLSHFHLLPHAEHHLVIHWHVQLV